MSNRTEQTDGQAEPPAGGPWHFLDARSKAIAKDGLKLEFDSHQDAAIGREVLNALEQQLAEANRTIERQRVWATAGLSGMADKENGEKLVRIGELVDRLEAEAAEQRSRAERAEARNKPLGPGHLTEKGWVQGDGESGEMVYEIDVLRWEKVQAEAERDRLTAARTALREIADESLVKVGQGTWEQRGDAMRDRARAALAETGGAE